MIDLKDAIKIAQIISKAPEERLPLILNILEKADFSVDGLEEVEEWRAFKEQAAVIDISEFKARLLERFPGEEKTIRIKPAEFNDFCKDLKLRPILVKRLLAKRGAIEISTDCGKTKYTKTAWVDGKAQRYIVVRKEAL